MLAIQAFADACHQLSILDILPEGVAVHDLGEQHLKDIQHEHIYELTVDGRSVPGRALRTEKPKSRQDEMAERFDERINAYVERQLERAFGVFGKEDERE